MIGLRLVELRLPFGDAPGLEPVTLEVAAGELVAIVGASGAGKSTLLRGVAGLAPATGGRVEVGGRDVSRLPAERRDAVYLHQSPVLFPHLDVFENVAFPLRVRGLAAGPVRDRVHAVLESVRMEDFARRRPSTLSGGQRHRVALARAIAARPAVLLLDEPLSALDPALRDEVRAAITAVQAAERPAILLVTHDIDEAGVLADRVGVLVDRRIAQLAPPAELFARPASLRIARFLGFPNELAGRVTADGRFESAAGVIGPVDVPGPAPAVAVFRAEAVRLSDAGARAVVTEVRDRVRGTSALVSLGAVTLEIAVAPGERPAPGSVVHVALDPERILLYPAEATDQ